MSAATMSNYSLDPGFRFVPTDQQIVGFILKKLLVENQPLTSTPPYNAVIHNCSLFGTKSEPWEIWTDNGGDQLDDDQPKELYFLSPLKRVTPKRVDRKVGHLGCGGSWNEKAVSKMVMINKSSNPISIGRKRNFHYVNEAYKDDIDWYLDEYSLFAGPKKNKRDTSYDYDFVICRMRKKINGSSGTVKRDRECLSSPDHPSKEELPETKKMKKNHAGSVESSQNMNVMNNTTDDHDEPQGSSSALVTYGNFDYDDSSLFDEHTTFTIRQLLWESESNEVSSPIASGLSGTDGGAEEVCYPSNVEDVGNQSMDCNNYLCQSSNEVSLPTASWIGAADEGANDVYYPSNFEDVGNQPLERGSYLYQSSYDVPLPNISWLDGADGRAEEVCGSDFFENVEEFFLGAL